MTKRWKYLMCFVCIVYFSFSITFYFSPNSEGSKLCIYCSTKSFNAVISVNNVLCKYLNGVIPTMFKEFVKYYNRLLLTLEFKIN